MCQSWVSLFQYMLKHSELSTRTVLMVFWYVDVEVIVAVSLAVETIMLCMDKMI